MAFRIATLLRNLFPTLHASNASSFEMGFCTAVLALYTGFEGFEELDRAMAIRQEWREFKINATSISLMSEMFVCVLKADCCKACEIHSL